MISRGSLRATIEDHFSTRLFFDQLAYAASFAIPPITLYRRNVTAGSKAARLFSNAAALNCEFQGSGDNPFSICLICR